MQTTFRFPGSSDYAYAQITTSEGSPQDNARELRDVDEAFLNIVGNLLSTGCAMVAMGPLQPQVIQQPAYQQPQEAPQWLAAPPQEAQGYSVPPQGYNPPQNAPQAPQGAYQQPQYAPQQVNTPPGQSAPLCGLHGQPATFKAAGVSQRTGKSYTAFWSCPQRDSACNKASNFPNP